MDAWVTVHLGPVWQAELLQGLLLEHGIEVFLPDATTKVVDPFATGPLPMLTQVQVRPRDVQRAKELLASAGSTGAAASELEALALSAPPDPSLGVSPEDAASAPDPETAGSERERAQEVVERLATRTRWAALLFIAFPWAIACGLRYLGVARRRGLRSAKHRLTVAALGLALLEPIAALAFWILLATADTTQVGDPW